MNVPSPVGSATEVNNAGAVLSQIVWAVPIVPGLVMLLTVTKMTFEVLEHAFAACGATVKVDVATRR